MRLTRGNLHAVDQGAHRERARAPNSAVLWAELPRVQPLKDSRRVRQECGPLHIDRRAGGSAAGSVARRTLSPDARDADRRERERHLSPPPGRCWAKQCDCKRCDTQSSCPAAAHAASAQPDPRPRSGHESAARPPLLPRRGRGQALPVLRGRLVAHGPEPHRRVLQQLMCARIEPCCLSCLLNASRV